MGFTSTSPAKKLRGISAIPLERIERGADRHPTLEKVQLAKVTLGATIPVAQYANLQPVIEAEGETIDAAMDAALRHIKDLWDRTAEKPLTIDRNAESPSGREVLRCRVSGAEVLFDPVAHTYHDKSSGNRYLGGSTFASSFEAPFVSEVIAEKMAAKHGVEAKDILAMWALNAEASSTLGTAVHAALQLYGEYLELSQGVKGTDESALTKNAVLRPIVEAFFTEERKAQKAFYEEFVADSRTLRCGLIDRLVVGDNGLWVEDFKTNASLKKPTTVLEPFKDVVEDTKLGIYYLQLSFYAHILMAHGRVVEGLRIHHWDGGGWVTYEHPVVDLTPAFREGK